MHKLGFRVVNWESVHPSEAIGNCGVTDRVTTLDLSEEAKRNLVISEG